MKKSSRIAYGGLFTGLTVLFLFCATILPFGRWALCGAAGIIVTIPMSMRHVRMGVMIYCASSFLSFLLIPSKKYALTYFLIFGLYPLVKYAAEHTRSCFLEIIIKFVFATSLGFMILLLLMNGFLPGLYGYLHISNAAIAVIPFYLLFWIIDLILSKMIAMLHVIISRQ